MAIPAIHTDIITPLQAGVLMAKLSEVGTAGQLSRS